MLLDTLWFLHKQSFLLRNLTKKHVEIPQLVIWAQRHNSRAHMYRLITGLLCVLVGLSHWDVYMRIPILIKSSQALWLSSRRSLLIQLGKRSKSSVLLSSAFLLIQIFPQCLLWVCFQDFYPSFYPLHPLMTEYIKWILYENGRCTSCLLWICSDSCSRAAVYPALLRWRLPGIPKSPRTKPSPGGGRWCTLPPEWRPARTAHSPQNDSMTRSSSSQNLKVHNMRDTEMSLKIILLKKII